MRVQQCYAAAHLQCLQQQQCSISDVLFTIATHCRGRCWLAAGCSGCCYGEILTSPAQVAHAVTFTGRRGLAKVFCQKRSSARTARCYGRIAHDSHKARLPAWVHAHNGRLSQHIRQPAYVCVCEGGGGSHGAETLKEYAQQQIELK